jgi:integrase
VKKAEEITGRWVSHLLTSRRRATATIHSYASTISAYAAHLGERDPFAVSIEDMEAWIARPSAKTGALRAPATVKREADTLRAFYRWCQERGLCNLNPASGLHGPTVHNDEPSPIPESDWRKMWDDSSGMLRLAYGLGFFGGLRRHEILGLRGMNIGNGELVHLPRKGGDSDTVEFLVVWDWFKAETPQLTGNVDFPKVLASHREAGTALVFADWAASDGIDPNALNKRMTGQCKRLGLPPYTPHQLRHSCATYLLRSGWRLELVAHYLNHSSVDVTRRYAKVGGMLAQHLATLRREMKSR